MSSYRAPQGPHINPYHAMTLDEIGKIMGITRERVRQIERSALLKLRRKGAVQQLLDLAREYRRGRDLECGFIQEDLRTGQISRGRRAANRSILLADQVA